MTPFPLTVYVHNLVDRRPEPRQDITIIFTNLDGEADIEAAWLNFEGVFMNLDTMPIHRIDTSRPLFWFQLPDDQALRAVLEKVNAVAHATAPDCDAQDAQVSRAQDARDRPHATADDDITAPAHPAPAAYSPSMDITEPQPLSCDCYPGCWGDHSKDWPRINGELDEIESLFRFAHGILPPGTYVLYISCPIDREVNHLRIQTGELLLKLLNEYKQTQLQLATAEGC